MVSRDSTAPAGASSRPDKSTSLLAPEALQKALDEQQASLWRLRSLIQCVTEATVGGGGVPIDDPLAAMLGLVDFADMIHNQADPEAVLQCAAEAQAAAELEERGPDCPAVAEGPESIQ